MEKLIEELKTQIATMNKADGSKYNLSEEFLGSSLNSIYPFNEFEYIISHLIATETITLQQYLDIRNRYLERNKYKYRYVFEITAPRIFGEKWAQGHLNKVVPELQLPSKSYDPDYKKGKYDFWYNGIKIEVKASRALWDKSNYPFEIRALSSDSEYRFKMNFQQIKPACCDVFVLIAVWRDVIRYWVLSSDEVKNNRHYSPSQHLGNKGEGQLWIKSTNINDFDEYEVDERDILTKIREKGKK